MGARLQTGKVTNFKVCLSLCLSFESEQGDGR